MLFFAALIGVRESARRDVAPPTVEWGEAINGVSVGLFLTNTEFQVGEPIEITVFVKNDSEEVLHLPKYPAPWYFSVVATGTDRKPLPQRARPSSGVVSSTPVQPGKTKAYTLDLNEFLVITNRDKLVITVTRLFHDKTGDQSASSRNVLITILDRREKTSGDASRSAAMDSTAARPFHSPVPSETSASFIPTPDEPTRMNTSAPANGSVLHDGHTFTLQQKWGAGLTVILLAISFAILWRSARRKSGT